MNSELRMNESLILNGNLVPYQLKKKEMKKEVILCLCHKY